MSNRRELAQQIIRSDQRGITGLETAIVLIAFVVVASVFAFAVITTGIFSAEQAQQSAQAGVEAVKSTMNAKGSLMLAEAISSGSPSINGTPTLMTDGANGAFIVEGVSVGDTIRNVTDGSSGIVASFTATTVTTLSALKGGTANTWVTTDTYEIDMNSISEIKFKVVPSPGAEPFSLEPPNTVVTFIDGNNHQNTTYLATIPFGGGADPFATANTAYWTHTWLVGDGPAINIGDVVEFTLSVKNLTIPLTTNSSFSVEIVPQTGSALAISSTTPLAIKKVMNLN